MYDLWDKRNRAWRSSTTTVMALQAAPRRVAALHYTGLGIESNRSRMLPGGCWWNAHSAEARTTVAVMRCLVFAIRWPSHESCRRRQRPRPNMSLSFEFLFPRSGLDIVMAISFETVRRQCMPSPSMAFSSFLFEAPDIYPLPLMDFSPYYIGYLYRHIIHRVLNIN
jgi:hypothetical protein